MINFQILRSLISHEDEITIYLISVSIFALLSLIISFTGIKWLNQRRIKRWRKHLHQDLTTHQHLYVHVNGFDLSHKARAHQDALEYIYGEILFEPFIALLTLCHPNPSTVFYDLGSGVGKAVIACSMVFNVKKSCGIEIFPLLHECALKQKDRLGDLALYKKQAFRVEFILSDFLYADIRDATLIFINSTAYFGDYWLDISRHLEAINPGSLVISTSKPLQSIVFKTIKTTQVEMSWGVATAFIQERQQVSF